MRLTASKLNKLESWAGKGTIQMDASVLNQDLLDGEIDKELNNISLMSLASTSLEKTRGRKKFAGVTELRLSEGPKGSRSKKMMTSLKLSVRKEKETDRE